MRVLIILSLLQYVFGEYNIEINYPKNGAPVTGPEVNVGIRLNMDSGPTSQHTTLCVGTLYLPDEANSSLTAEVIGLLSAVSKPISESDQCFGVEVESRNSPLESEIMIQFNKEGWHFLRLTLEVNNKIASSYLTQVFVALETELDDWSCVDQALGCVWLDKSMLSKTKSIWGIDWPIEDGVGWGTIGRNIVTESSKLGITTLPLHTVDGMNVGASDRIAFHNNMRMSALLRRNLVQESHSVDLVSLPRYNLEAKDLDGHLCVVDLPFPIFHALGRYGPQNAISTSSIYNRKECYVSSPHGNGVYWGSYNVAIMFSENVTMTMKDLATLKLFDVVLGGSTWNVNILRRSLPASSVALFRQGINPSLFDSSQETGFKYRQVLNKKDDKFYIFSGGKLEYRKGQDLVVAAFRKFLKVCPNAVLVVAWANAWAETVKTINESSHTVGYPSSRMPLPGEPPVLAALNVLPWLEAHDIPRDSVIDLGVVGHAQMAQVMRVADVGLFPNRCEGGTNLVAMEAVAVGLPLILSTVTGHADLAEFLNVSPINHGDGGSAYIGLFQHSKRYEDKSRLGWGESDVDEIVESLSYVYRNDRGTAAAAGTRVGSQRMRQEWSWMCAVEGLYRVVSAGHAGVGSSVINDTV